MLERCFAAILIALLWSSAALAQTKPQEPPATPFFQEAADCTAAFKARVIERRAQPRSDARDDAILRDTEWGFIYIGVAYKRGLRNPEADQMLKIAEKRWSLLSKSEQTNRLASCTVKAQQLMDDVTGLERFFVRNRAKARVDKWLDKE